MKLIYLAFLLLACGEGKLGGSDKVEVHQLPGEVGKQGENGQDGSQGPKGEQGAQGLNGGSATVAETESQVIFTGGDGKSVAWNKPQMPIITICHCTPLGWVQDTGPAIELLIAHFSDESAFLGPCRGSDGTSLVPEGGQL